MLARHLDPPVAVPVDGTDVLDPPSKTVRAHVAVVDDETHVFATTVGREPAPRRPDADDAAVAPALERARARATGSRAARRARHGARHGGRGVSGGERPGSASPGPCWPPAVVLLDEPVAHLDHATAPPSSATYSLRRTAAAYEQYASSW